MDARKIVVRMCGIHARTCDHSVSTGWDPRPHLPDSIARVCAIHVRSRGNIARVYAIHVVECENLARSRAIHVRAIELHVRMFGNAAPMGRNRRFEFRDRREFRPGVEES